MGLSVFFVCLFVLFLSYPVPRSFSSGPGAQSRGEALTPLPDGAACRIRTRPWNHKASQGPEGPEGWAGGRGTAAGSRVRLRNSSSGTASLSSLHTAILVGGCRVFRCRTLDCPILTGR